ncbi:1-phosphofructokinase [Euzebya tangerina]|uniref:1-phosphofructokinase n=1 Tax=Euzebya tangerina TaxID=591198 RepID=UPI000E3156A0|nr:1-phosphofructokinase [Euzebya tangerina]
MIVTLTPNPSVDRTMSITTMQAGAVIRSVATTQVDPGGKGINVVRALAKAGVSGRAVIPCGGAEGRHLVELLDARGITPVVVPIAEPVRVNIALTEPDGTTTKINETGPTLQPQEIQALLDVTVAQLKAGDWLVGSGSLPPRVDDHFWASLAGRAHQVGAKVAIDTSGASFKAALDAGPDLVKPNREELEESVGTSLSTIGAVVDAGRELIRRGAGAVLASLGADGAVLVTPDQALLASSPPITPVSSVGAGDSTLTGYLIARVRDTDDHAADHAAALRLAVAYGTAAVQLPGSSMPGPAHLRPDDITITTDLDLDRRLAA